MGETVDNILCRYFEKNNNQNNNSSDLEKEKKLK